MIKMMRTSLLFSLSTFLFLIACGQQNESVQNVKADEMISLYESNGGVILDVRTMQEIRKGHIENAVFMDFLEDDFSTQVEQLPKDQPIYVYCWVGGRSEDAADILHKKGFTNVYNLLGGYRGWTQAGLKTVPYEGD